MSDKEKIEEKVFFEEFVLRVQHYCCMELLQQSKMHKNDLLSKLKRPEYASKLESDLFMNKHDVIQIEVLFDELIRRYEQILRGRNLLQEGWAAINKITLPAKTEITELICVKYNVSKYYVLKLYIEYDGDYEKVIEHIHNDTK
jgi:hypothetical protein